MECLLLPFLVPLLFLLSWVVRVQLGACFWVYDRLPWVKRRDARDAIASKQVRDQHLAMLKAQGPAWSPMTTSPFDSPEPL